MYVCTRTQRRLIRWVLSNFTLVIFIQAAKLSFKPPTSTSKQLNQDGFEMNRLAKKLLLSSWKKISSKAELSERYMNHCVRASTITALYQRGVDAKQICTITKHKDERSLSHHISQTTSEQKRQCSRLLQEAFYGHPATQTSRPSTNSKGEKTGRTAEVTSALQTLQNHFVSLAQPYPNGVQHIQIGTMNVYHGAGPSQHSRLPLVYVAYIKKSLSGSLLSSFTFLSPNNSLFKNNEYRY